MKKQIAVVTGASSGFGLLTSIELAKRGFYVIATMRDVQKKTSLLKEAERQGVLQNIFVHPLDVTLRDSIEHWKTFMQKQGRIDVLVNNAGFAGAGFAEEIPMDEYRRQFETNVFGVFAVTQAILPMMREKRKGKIINVSSISGRFGFPGLSPYVSSKYALEGWSESLRLEMKPFGIDVVLVEPGSFQTNIWSSGKHVTENSLKEESPYYETMNKLEQHIEKGSSKFGNPQEVAELIGSIALKEKTTLRYTVGKGIKASLFFKSILPWTLYEKMFLKQLR